MLSNFIHCLRARLLPEFRGILSPRVGVVLAGWILAPSLLMAAANPGSLVSQSIGNPTPTGTFTVVPGGINIAAGGADIGGTSDQFAFAHEMITGDFDVRVRVAGLTLSDAWSKAGLMARASLTTTNPMAATLTSPSGVGSYFVSRTGAVSAATSSGNLSVNYPNTWLRLRRVGSVFTGLGSFDGENWSTLGTITLTAMPAAAYVGLAVSSHVAGQASTAQFRDYSDVIGGTIGVGRIEIEPPGPSRRTGPFAITEILHSPAPPSTNELEFVEIYNSNPFPEEIGGYRLTGEINFTFPEGMNVPGNAYVIVAKDPATFQSVYGISALGPLTNALASDGTLRLRNKEGAILLEIPYSSHNPWPIGADQTGHSLVLTRASYGEADPKAWSISAAIGGSPGRHDFARAGGVYNVVINEFLAHTDLPLVDYVELYNHGNQAINISGCFVSDSATSNKFVVPANTTIPARGFVVFDQNQMGFGLSSAGETIYFRAPDNRVIDAIEFEAQANGISSGRSPDGAKEFYPLAGRTPGAPNGASRVSDIVINELMYKPISRQSDDEYIELLNRSGSAVNIGAWRFTAGINYTFPSNTMIPAGGYLVVARNTTNLLAKYSQLTSGNTFGDFGGTLANSGERVALARPDLNISTNNAGQVRTNTVYVVVDEVTYGTGGSWPFWANEGGSSLELIDPRSNHRLAHNWAESDETAKAPWADISFTGVLDNGSENSPILEGFLLGEGECLVDNIEVSSPSVVAGVNICTNGTFESGLGGWLTRGDHIRTGVDPVGSGFGGGRALHVRSDARGDSIMNRLRTALTTSLPIGAVGTIRAKVRWLRGWPEIVLRTHGNYLECFGRMTLPNNPGTPGAPNSRAASNNAPALYEITHQPILPDGNQAVAVTARVHDPDGLTALTLKYRIDPATTQTSVAMVDDGTGLDAVSGDGVFTGVIPAQSANTLVAFQVTTTDTLGATRLYPYQAPSYARPFECLVRFGEPVAVGGFGTYRQWMTADNATDWQNRPSLSNERVFETFVYGNFRVIYNTSAKWAGSPYHQFVGSPVTQPAHYSIELPSDDQFLGTDNLNKVHAPGNGPFDDGIAQREQFCYWTARQLGLPYNYRRFVNMYFNGNRRVGSGVQAQIMEDTQTPGADVINSIFPDDTDGDLYKIQPWFETDDVNTGSVGFRRVSWAGLQRYLTVSNSVPVHKTARYRHNFLVRSPDETANNYNPVFRLIDAANTPTNGWETFNAAMESVVDIEQWMRIFSVHHSAGDWDHFGSQNSQNMYGYVGRDGIWKLMIWDMNIVLASPSNPWGPGQNLFLVNAEDPIMPRLFGSPKFRRMYLRALKEICNGPWLSARVNANVDPKHSALTNSGIVTSSPQVIKDFVTSARTLILNTIAAEEGATFRVTSPATVATSGNFVVISGEAPVDVASIRVNGIAYEVKWTRVRNWEIRVAVEQGTTTFNIDALNYYGQPIAGATATVTVNYSGGSASPEGLVVFNEILYNPVTPDSSFVELYNRSPDHSFEIGGWRINGLDYMFPPGTVLSNGQYLVLTRSIVSYFAVGGTNVAYPYAQFEGKIDPDGETLSLIKPGTNGVPDLVVDRIRYEARMPWASLPIGTSLQLMDNAQDNSRSSAWSYEPGGGPLPLPSPWVQVTRTGNLLLGTNLLLWISTAGSSYIDDISLTQTNPGSPNIVLNGDFENGSTAPWILGTNYAESVVVNNFSHSGNRSLLLRGGAPSTGSSLPITVQQFISLNPNYETNAIYTFSYWIAVDTNAVIVSMRTLPGAQLNMSGTNFVPVAPPTPQFATPGAPNIAVTTNLPPYDPVWLNEVQVDNAAGPLDNAGQRDPWIELYNGGSNPVSLAGYYLANNYDTNLTQWPFPAGTTINPGQFVIVWADGQPGQTAPGFLHTTFRLNSVTGSVALVRFANNQPQITDYLTYSGLGVNLSYGDYPDGQPFSRFIMQATTPSGTNISRGVNVFINEWMASNTNSPTSLVDPADGNYDDWFELYNAGDTAVDVGGYYLTDNLANRNQYRIPTNGQYTIPPGGFLLVWADNDSNQNAAERPDLHVSFQLARGGEAIGLYAPDAQTVIDTVSFGDQTNNISQGRFGDGASSIYFMTTPTPGGPNIVSGLGNQPPSLASIANRSITLGQTVTFTAVGSDPDAGQTLSYSLGAGAPSGAAIGTSSGQFVWTPNAGQAPSTNNITVRVTDSGIPALSATRSFTVTVQTGPHVSIATGTGAPGQVSLLFETVPGRTYRVDYKNRLTDAEWTPLAPAAPATGNFMSVQDNMGANPQRFYRIVQTD